MKYVFTFNEVNFGRIEIEADREPRRDEIIKQILEGEANYHDTDFTDFCLVEIGAQTQETEKITVAGTCPSCGNDVLDYEGGDLSERNYIYKWQCAKCGTYGKECYDLIFSGQITDGKVGDELNKATTDVMRCLNCGHKFDDVPEQDELGWYGSCPECGASFDIETGVDRTSRTDKNIVWDKYLKYLRDWADSHSEPGFQGLTPACYDEWYINEYQECDE